VSEIFLKNFTKELKYQLNDLCNPEALNYVYYTLLPNITFTKNGRRPFSMALKQNSPKCVESMLELLKLNSKQDYMRYIDRYLLKLLNMRSEVFYKFFDSSC
jgi:hypothetical protein